MIGEAAYDDSAGAKRVTEQQLAADADVIFGMGDGASFGMIQAIEEHNAQEDATKAWFIDVIGDKKAEHGDVLLSSVLFDYSGIYKQMIDDLEAGTSARSTRWTSRTAVSLARPARGCRAGVQGCGRGRREDRSSTAQSRSPPSAMPRR